MRLSLFHKYHGQQVDIFLHSITILKIVYNINVWQDTLGRCVAFYLKAMIAFTKTILSGALV